jgi:uncharacterized protein DUF6815
MAPIVTALAEVGVEASFVAYSDDSCGATRSELFGFDGALVWVDPIAGDGRDRSRLDAMLRDVASRGVWVSAHPDTIMKMGTKEVLHRTRELGWGCDTRVYATLEDFTNEFPAMLATGARVVKPNRGNGGIGVHKVELTSPPPVDPDSIVRVQSARLRDEVAEEMSLRSFIDSCASGFIDADGSGILIDQPFQARITDGMIRCYVVKDEVVGFARQYASEPAPDIDPSTPRRVFGLPAQKTMFGPHEPTLRALRERVESEWVPGMQKLVDVDTASLPALWDADFLLGAVTASGEDTYVLCEINASSVLPFPPEALPALARATLAALR